MIFASCISIHSHLKMVLVKVLFYFVSLQMISTHALINLYFTDIDNQDHYMLQQNCFFIFLAHSPKFQYDQIMDFCMSEPASDFSITKNDFITNFTFFQLAHANITSEQLFLWSAPIDLIEHYQYYLNEKDISLAEYIFYNCTWPQFGPRCQYQFEFSYENFTDIRDYIFANIQIFDESQMKYSCYIHLTCIRSPGVQCLDWTDICDGKVDCLNGGVDEEHCWQLEINDCQNDEYKCYSGICLPKEFVKDRESDILSCIPELRKHFGREIRSIKCNTDIYPLVNSIHIVMQEFVLKHF